MKVYILIEEYAYEYLNIVGVFSTREAAIECHSHLIGVVAPLVDENEAHSHHWWFEIREYEVR